MAPSMASPAQSIPCKALHAARPRFHNSRKTSASAHSWKRRWAELLDQIPASFRAFPCHPVRSTKKRASLALRSSTRARWHPRGYGLRGGSSGSMRSHHSSGIRQSRQALSWSSGISEAPVGEDVSLQNTIKTAYWDKLSAEVITRQKGCAIPPHRSATYGHLRPERHRPIDPSLSWPLSRQTSPPSSAGEHYLPSRQAIGPRGSRQAS
jgi:hypothetical protein